MKIYGNLEELNIGEKTAVALGNFDGVHIGHQKIMRNAIAAAAGIDHVKSAAGKDIKEKMKSLCFTFSNLPFNFIMDREASDPAAIKLICSEADKVKLIEGMGFDILVNVPFDENIMTMRAHDFFESILKEKLNAGHISVGFNYTYGARAEGKPGILIQECENAGIGISVEDAVTLEGEVISSTLIRELIKEGDMERAFRYLGRPLSFSGRVEHGRHLGSANGIPTANIFVDESRMAPPSGVYFTRILVDGSEYKSISNIGFKPTVQEKGKRSIETNIFEFSGDLYGKEITVFFDHFSRPEKKFESKKALFAQIACDCASAQKFYQLTPRFLPAESHLL